MVKDQKGFTLVELMVVVAIIGLLSAVAVPNFKKYQAKAKIAEAKLQLSAIYTAEAGFFSDYNMYTGCLLYAGYDPSAEVLNRYYAMGIYDGHFVPDPVAYSSAVQSGLNTTECPTNTGSGADFFWAGKGIGSSIMDLATGPNILQNGVYSSPGDCTLTDTESTPGPCLGDQSDAEHMAYGAVAFGFISASSNSVENVSYLTMNQNKTLKMMAPGY